MALTRPSLEARTVAGAALAILVVALPAVLAIEAVKGDDLAGEESSGLQADGGRIVQMVWDDLKPRDILKAGAFSNAVKAVLAIGGSLNAVKHLQAVATEAENGVDVYGMFEQLGPQTPVLAGVRPIVEHMIEEFEAAGGCRALLPRPAGRAHRAGGPAHGRGARPGAARPGRACVRGAARGVPVLGADRRVRVRPAPYPAAAANRGAARAGALRTPARLCRTGGGAPASVSQTTSRAPAADSGEDSTVSATLA